MSQGSATGGSFLFFEEESAPVEESVAAGTEESAAGASGFISSHHESGVTLMLLEELSTFLLLEGVLFSDNFDVSAGFSGVGSCPHVDGHLTDWGTVRAPALLRAEAHPKSGGPALTVDG